MQDSKEIHNCQVAYARCLLAFTGIVLQQGLSAVLFLVEKRTPMIFWELEFVTLQPGALAPVCYDLECNMTAWATRDNATASFRRRSLFNRKKNNDGFLGTWLAGCDLEA